MLGFGAYELRFRISEKLCNALAVVGSYLQRASVHRLLSPIQSELALLDCAHATDGRNLVSRRKIAPSLDSQSGARLRHWIDLFLDGSVVAHHGHGPGLVRYAILHGDLFRGVGVVLWIASAATNSAGKDRHEMGPDVKPSSSH